MCVSHVKGPFPWQAAYEGRPQCHLHPSSDLTWGEVRNLVELLRLP